MSDIGDQEEASGREEVRIPDAGFTSPPSPFRGTRFENQTRRAAIERRFGKLRKSPSSDEKKEETLISFPPQDTTPLVSNKSTRSGIHLAARRGILTPQLLVKGKEPIAPMDSEARRNVPASTLHLRDSGKEEECETDTRTNSSVPLHLADTKVYYKVVYRGVVSLLSSPNLQSSKSGTYLSYGDIFQGPTLKASSGQTSQHKSLADNEEETGGKFIRVEKLVTPGFAFEPEEHSIKKSAPNTETEKQEASCSEYLFSCHNGQPIVEKLAGPPKLDESTFLYRVVSTAPVPILLGPCLDAPRAKAMALPGTVQEVSMRLSVPTQSKPNDTEVTFLRLSHRRGWISDRIRTARGGFVSTVHPVENAASSIDDCDTSVLSAMSALSIATTPSVARRRHRPPRRRIDAPVDSHHGIKNVMFPATMPKKNVTSSLANDGSSKGVTSPGSNVSILSDDDSSVDQTTVRSRESNSVTHDSIQMGKNSGAVSGGSYFLMRVTAPRGLRVLDAPHFQVSSLIHGNTGKPSVSSSHSVSQFEAGVPKSHNSIFQTMSGRLSTTGPSRTSNPAVFEKGSKSRILPRGVLFEASKRMESTGAFSQGDGLIKLSDNSGWAIVPRKEELDEQYKSVYGAASVGKGEIFRAFDEVGQAMMDGGGSEVSASDASNVPWLRVLTRGGLVVTCPPPKSVVGMNDGDTSPTSSRESSTISGSNNGSGFGLFGGNDSDVASSVGSAFMDAMFRTPKKKRDADDGGDGTRVPSHLERSVVNETVACGLCVEVEKWNETPGTRPPDYVRLRGGQGWLPVSLRGKVVASEVRKPEQRFGSFWFRVQHSKGIKVRLGPSKRAPSIKSEDGIYFRFECGEFLRASEILTIFSEDNQPLESFAKLYRNRHVSLHRGHEEFRHLDSLTSPAEWVQIYSQDEHYLKECVEEPSIERHRQGWRYNAVPESGVSIRKGPSLASEKTGVVLFGGESVIVIERVTAAGEDTTWLRLRDGKGWVHDIDENGQQTMIPHSLRHRAQMHSRPHKPRLPRDGKEIPYNAIVARLFHNDDGPPLDANTLKMLENQRQYSA